MQWQLALPYTLPLFGIATVLLILLRYTWRRRTIPGAISLILLELGAVVWAVGYALEISTTGSDVALIWARLQYIGIMLLPVAWLTFAFAYSGLTRWHTPRVIGALSVIPAVTNLLVWTNDLHGWIWPQVDIDWSGAIPVLRFGHGPAFWVCNIYAQALLLIGTLIIIRAFLQSPRFYLSQLVSMLLAVVGPWLGNVAYITRWAPAQNLDLTPFAFCVTIVSVIFGIWRYRFLQVIPRARGYLFEYLADGILVLDEQNRIIDLNGAARRLLGTASGSIGQPAELLLAAWPELVEALRAPAQDRIEISVGDVEGQERVYDVHISRLHAVQQSAEVRIIAWNDVTEHRRAEAALRAQNQALLDLQENLIRARDEAEQASRAKTTFLANMSHELRTPLTAILGYADLMLLQLAQMPEVGLRQDLETIVRAGEHLLSLINTLLDLTKIEAGKLEPDISQFDADQLIVSIAQTVMPLVARNSNQLVINGGALIGPMRSDSSKLRQVLLNLIGNAAKFTERGVITLDVRTSDPPPFCADTERFAGPTGDWIVFEVSDTGIGIAPEQQANLFLPFSQVDSLPSRTNEGTGLGLYISRRLCQLLGGDITVESYAGGGSRFSVFLPRHLADAERSGSAEGGLLGRAEY